MQVGDQVKLVGVVKDIVKDKDSDRTSVLIATLDTPGNPSKEYWVNQANLAADPAAQPEAAAKPAEESAKPEESEPQPPQPHKAASSKK